jgi:hypothetical protein
MLAVQVSGNFSHQQIDQRWLHVIRQMIQKLRHRVDPLFTERTARHDNALPARRD